MKQGGLPRGGGTSFEQTILPADHPQHGWLTEGHEKTWEVKAASWEDAMTKYHEYMGWEPYVPMED